MNKEPEQITSDLVGVVRGDVYADILHRAAYSTDASIYRIVPRCVVAPRDAGDVAGRDPRRLPGRHRSHRPEGLRI